MNARQSSIHRLFTVVVTGMAAVLVTAVSALGASRAIVVTGWDPKQANRDALTAEADLAESIYRAKGYAITRVNHVSKEALLTLLCQADATHLFYAGHGCVANDAGDGIAQLELVPGAFPGGYLYFQEVIDRVPLNCRQRFRQVVLNACAQRQVGWAVAFPGALVWGFDTPITNATCKNDLQQNGAARTSPKTSAPRGGDEESGTSGLAPAPIVDPRIVSAIPVSFDFGSRTFRADGWWDYIDMPWRMSDTLGAAIGAKRFNVFLHNDEGGVTLLKGIEVSGGEVVAEQLGAFADPDFLVDFTGAAFEAATANIDSLPTLFAEGSAIITSNTTGLPDSVLFEAVSAVMFGKGAVVPVCEGDADGDGVIGLADLAIVITHWGISGVPGQLGDLNHDGSRGLGDVARVIANWGETCP